MKRRDDGLDLIGAVRSTSTDCSINSFVLPYDKIE